MNKNYAGFVTRKVPKDGMKRNKIKKPGFVNVKETHLFGAHTYLDLRIGIWHSRFKPLQHSCFCLLKI